MRWDNKKVVIMGLGLFGGGLAVAHYFISKKADVLVTDLREASQLKESLAALENIPIKLRLGCHCYEDFENAELIIVNPGVPESSPYLKYARTNNIPIDTEINIFLRNAAAPVIGVTGSNGKSTTTSMIHHIFTQAGYRSWVGGNIGKSLLEELKNIQKQDIIILELSSFQLERMYGISPHVAVVTNLSPNHLDRHHTMDGYAAAKQNILRFQKKSDFCILNDNSSVGQWHSLAQKISFGKNTSDIFFQKDAICWYQGERIVKINTRTLPFTGMANMENAMAAIATARSYQIGPEIIAKGLSQFSGLPHRMQFLGSFQGREIYEDSDATTPESTIAAIRSIKKPFILIAGGGDKGFNYALLGREIVENVKLLILMGDTSIAIRQACENVGTLQIVECKNMQQALEQARKFSFSGDTIVLSPASTSFGMFRNFAERGDIFQQLVKKTFATEL